jgi:hypothetical protein
MGHQISHTKLLRCEVQPGMFSDELIVSVKRSDGEVQNFFVPKEVVVIGSGSSRIKVEVQKRETTLIASIPTAEPSSFVSVRPEDVE